MPKFCEGFVIGTIMKTDKVIGDFIVVLSNRSSMKSYSAVAFFSFSVCPSPHAVSDDANRFFVQKKTETRGDERQDERVRGQ